MAAVRRAAVNQPILQSLPWPHTVGGKVAVQHGAAIETGSDDGKERRHTPPAGGHSGSIYFGQRK